MRYFNTENDAIFTEKIANYCHIVMNRFHNTAKLQYHKP